MAESKDPVARLAERQTWISRSAEMRAQNTIYDVVEGLGGDALRGVLSGDWLHEPLHSVLTDVPVGAWTATVAFDAIGAMGGGTALNVAADATLVVGLVGAAGAAITGMNDWSQVEDPRARKIGAVHGLLNVAATGLFVASCVERARKRRGMGRSLAALGYVLVAVSAHLGGNLVYEHGLGVKEGEASESAEG